MRGSSKEPRFDFPLASSALVISEEGIPIDFYVYAGNASEFKTMATRVWQNLVNKKLSTL